MSHTPAPPQEPPPSGSSPSGQRRRRTVVGSLAGAVVLAGGAVGLTLYLDGDEGKPAAGLRNPPSAAETEPSSVPEPPPSASAPSVEGAPGVWRGRSDPGDKLILAEPDGEESGTYYAELYVDGDRCRGEWGVREGESIIRLGFLCGGDPPGRSGSFEYSDDTLTIDWIGGPVETSVFTRAQGAV
ncbi:hypothetical protein [Streptomyces synnematoformans]|uniref:Serine/threonine protein kinase n=1 Tax=Streptomyces synnematoformans TaxID=415721 RepID=A0ABN2Y7A1_9ACTN